LVLVPRERGNSRLKCLALLTEVQLGMCSDCSHGLVPWELLSQLLVPWERRKFKTEVCGPSDRNEAGHVF